MSSTHDIPFGDHLRLLRERAGLTQEELAERAGLSRDAISALERGRRKRPYPPTLNALADALGLSDEERMAFRSLSRAQTTNTQIATPARAPLRIPEALTNLIGRSRELDDLAQMVSSRSSRMISIVGPGGVGKTRLSLEILRRLPAGAPDHVALIPLGDIWDPALVLPTIAEALGIRNPGGEALVAQISVVLEDQQTLLVLDNLEHVSGAAPVLAELIRACPSLTIVATSRAPLRLSTETVYQIDPFATGQHDTDAIDLFVERARQTLPGFVLTDRNRPVVQTICRRLDGLPLAIELAAARTKVLPPDALLKRLDSGIDLLSSGPRDSEPRLQSVRSAIAWSYDLLTPGEQEAFRALSAFHGAFSLEAAIRLLAALGIGESEAIDLISNLIDNCLLRALHSDDAEPRYAMMFTIQRFGLGELDASPSAAAVHRAHAEVTLQTAELAADAFRHRAGREQWPFFLLLEQERGNWRAALSWIHEHGETTLMLRLTTALAWFWYVRGPIREGQFWLERAVAMPHGNLPGFLRPRALVAKGLLEMNMQQTAAARTALEESLATAPAPGEPWWIASAELFLGLVETAEGNYVAAEDHLNRSITVYRSIPHEINASIAHGQLVAAALGQGDLERARSLGIAAAERQRGLNDMWGLGRSLGYLSLIASESGNVGEALDFIHETLTIRLENVSVVAVGPVEQHDPAQWQAGEWLDVASSFSILAVVMEACDDHGGAAQWFGAAREIHQLLGGVAEQLPERAWFDRARAATRSALGDAEYSRQAAGDERGYGADIVVRAIAAVDEMRLRRTGSPVS